MKKEMRLNIMIILIVICLAMLTACMKGAPDDAYMIDLTDERNVVINDATVFWADGDIEKNKLLEQFIFEEFNDCFNTNIPNVGKIEHGDKEKAIKAAEYFLKEYFGTRYIDAGNGKAKVNFKKVRVGENSVITVAVTCSFCLKRMKAVFADALI